MVAQFFLQFFFSRHHQRGSIIHHLAVTKPVFPAPKGHTIYQGKHTAKDCLFWGKINKSNV